MSCIIVGPKDDKQDFWPLDLSLKELLEFSVFGLMDLLLTIRSDGRETIMLTNNVPAFRLTVSHQLVCEMEASAYF